MNKTMTREEMESLVAAIESLDKIKIYGLKAAASEKYFAENGIDGQILVMPNAEEFVNGKVTPQTIPDLAKLVSEYIALIPQNKQKLLDSIDGDEARSILHGNAFYNEIPSYQAATFTPMFDSILEAYKGEYAVDLYDIPDLSIPFDSKETANTFIEIYANPCTLFLMKNGEAVEIGCY